MTDWTTVVLLGLALTAGSFVQASIGFGMAVVAAPFIVVFAPALMPTALLVTSMSLPVVQLVHAPRQIAWRPLRWALGAQLLLTPAGVALVAVLSPPAIATTVGVLILLTVAASVWAVEVRASARNAALAGAVSGVSATAASISGPFLALVLQHERPERLRATLAVFFLAGSAMAIGGLAFAGEITRGRVLAGVAWVPFVALGYAAAAPMRTHLDRGRLRTAVLWFCVIASLSVIARAVIA